MYNLINEANYYINGEYLTEAEEVIIATDATLSQILNKEIKRLGEKANLNHVNVSKVTNMSELFKHFNFFNGDISKWDTSNVVNMSEMFFGSRFNGNLSKWDVGNVKYMTQMFMNSKFNKDISNWDVSNVEKMTSMFAGSSTLFNKDISNWDVGNVKDVGTMFFGSRFNQDISKWNLSKNTKGLDTIFKNSKGIKEKPEDYFKNLK